MHVETAGEIIIVVTSVGSLHSAIQHNLMLNISSLALPVVTQESRKNSNYLKYFLN